MSTAIKLKLYDCATDVAGIKLPIYKAEYVKRKANVKS